MPAPHPTYSPDAAAELSRHPKLTALRGLLAEYADRSSFHGALFVRTHEATRCLASLLAAAPDLRFLQVGVGGWVGAERAVLPLLVGITSGHHTGTPAPPRPFSPKPPSLLPTATSRA